MRPGCGAGAGAAKNSRLTVLVASCLHFVCAMILHMTHKCLVPPRHPVAITLHTTQTPRPSSSPCRSQCPCREIFEAGQKKHRPKKSNRFNSKTLTFAATPRRRRGEARASRTRWTTTMISTVATPPPPPPSTPRNCRTTTSSTTTPQPRREDPGARCVRAPRAGGWAPPPPRAP